MENGLVTFVPEFMENTPLVVQFIDLPEMREVEDRDELVHAVEVEIHDFILVDADVFQALLDFGLDHVHLLRM